MLCQPCRRDCGSMQGAEALKKITSTIHPHFLATAHAKFQKHLTVKPVDITGTIELFEKSRVEELFGIGAFRRGNLIGELG